MATIKCPSCDLQIDEEDLHAQRAHMEKQHPEVIRARLVREGLWDHDRNQPYYPRPNDQLVGRQWPSSDG